MSVLILSSPLDPHAAAVLWGLKKIGCAAVIWDWTKFPRDDVCTWTMSSAAAPLIQFSADGSDNARTFDAIWYRRPGKATPMRDSHPDDADIVRDESNEYLRNILPTLGHEKTLWVNAPEASRHAGRKLVQLVAARDIGFRVPDTLVGNDHAKVVAFFDKHPGGIIFKAFRPGNWHNQDGSLTALRTSAVRSEHLDSVAAVRGCPGIYQELIEKDHELRVTVIGDAVLAMAIYSQQDGRTVDHRVERGNEVPMRAVRLPDEIAAKCILLCRSLELNYGAIDLIVTATGEHVFLEVNEAGQFLGFERFDESLTMLDTFCRLLARGKGAAEPALRFADWLESDAHRALANAIRAELPQGLAKAA